MICRKFKTVHTVDRRYRTPSIMPSRVICLETKHGKGLARKLVLVRR